MAKKTIKARMVQRQDTRAGWEAANPTLLKGELGVVSDDPNLYKVGDGVTSWKALPFRGFDGTLVHDMGTSPNAVMSQEAVTRAIETEAQTRAESAQQLEGRIETEAQERAESAQQLEGKIEAEAQARAESAQQLESRIEAEAQTIVALKKQLDKALAQIEVLKQSTFFQNNQLGYMYIDFAVLG